MKTKRPSARTGVGVLQMTSCALLVFASSSCSDTDDGGGPAPGSGGAPGAGGQSAGGSGTESGGATGAGGVRTGGTSAGAGGAHAGEASTGGANNGTGSSPSSSGGSPGSGGAAGGSGGVNPGPGGANPGSGGSSTGSGGASPGSGGSKAASGGQIGAGGAGPVTPGMWTLANHPCYQWNELPATNVPWQHITHLIIGYLWPKSSGSGYTLDTPPGVCGDLASVKQRAAAFVTAGHQAGKKVTMLLGGAGGNPGNVWNTATTSANVGAFAQNIVTMMKSWNIDGVDLDWEDNVEGPKMVALAKEMRARWPEGFITIPTGPTGEDAAGLAGAKDAVDVFEPMTYLGVEQWGGWYIPVPLTPLFAFKSNPYSIDIVRKKWESAGVPASKLVLGVGGYGTAWTDTNGDDRGPIGPYANIDTNGPAEGETRGSHSDNQVTQQWLSQTLAAHGNLVEGWDDVGKCSYWHAAAANQLVTVAAPGGGGNVKLSAVFYESPRSMAEKKNYVTANGMKGFMFWTVSQLMNGSASPVLEAL